MNKQDYKPETVHSSYPAFSLEKYGVWIPLVLVLLLLLVVFYRFVSGEAYYLFVDSALDPIMTYYPQVVHLANYLRSEGFPLWSFAQGMGQNIMAKSLADPFYLIVYLAGSSHAAYAIIWMEIAKISVAAFAFYHFLKLLNLSYATTIVGTLLYCFSGFMIVGGQWWFFSTEACLLSILLLGFEKLYRQNKWHIFTLAVALIAAHNPFELYTSGKIGRAHV